MVVNRFADHPSKKKGNGFTLIEILVTVALFVGFTVFLIQAFNQGYAGVGQVHRTNQAVYLANGKLEEIRNLPYDSIASQPVTPIAGFPGYESVVDVSFPQAPNQNIKGVQIFIRYGDNKTQKVEIRTQVARI